MTEKPLCNKAKHVKTPKVLETSEIIPRSTLLVQLRKGKTFGTLATSACISDFIRVLKTLREERQFMKSAIELSLWIVKYFNSCMYSAGSRLPWVFKWSSSASPENIRGHVQMDHGRFIYTFLYIRGSKLHICKAAVRCDSHSSVYKNQANLMDLYVHVNTCVCLSSIYNCLTQ
jgi:hypothetical protein